MGVTFVAIEAIGVEPFLAQLRDELVTQTYRPMRNRHVAIPKDGGRVRVLGIPAIWDRVVQGALKLLLEPIFEADFRDGSYGYRPKRTAHQAISRVAKAIIQNKTRVIDVDLAAFFDTVRHDRLLAKVARRIQDPEILRLVKLIVKASGRRGVPQGGVISPLLANIYLTEVDEMLEQLKENTRQGQYTYLEYARFADDLVVLVDGYCRHARLAQIAERKLREAWAQLGLQVNEEKSRIVDLSQGDSFGFLGFDFRRVRSRRGVWRPQYIPKVKRRTALLRKLKEVFRRWQSQPVGRMIAVINPIVRGWVNYFRIGHASRCLTYVKDWVERKVRRHMMRVRHRRGFGWKRWSKVWLYTVLGLFGDYRVRYGGSA